VYNYGFMVKMTSSL